MSDNDMMAVILDIQKQLTYLEQKVDKLLRMSEHRSSFQPNREFSGPRTDRPFRRPGPPYAQRFDPNRPPRFDPNAPRPERPFRRPDRPGFDPNRGPQQGPAQGKPFPPKRKFFNRDRGR